MWVKICANTNAEDAQAAIALGADAVGFVFAPSKRQVNAAQVRAIADRLPPHIERVGVFLPTSVEEIAAAVSEANLTTIQLHGGIDTAFARSLIEATGAQLIQSIAWTIDDPAAASEALRQLEEAADAGLGDRVLIDAKVGATSGGLGVAFDWQQAQSAFTAAAAAGLKLIVAGGLRPDNVAEAIRILRPWGVDVASGVEREPGRKDLAKLKAFVEAARTAP
jgi:phosphoribosylanthranilate isomerase